MSNVIPIVSSSPPPLDDDASFKWASDDDEDDYGNFTSAPSLSDTTLGNHSSFNVNWSASEASLSSTNDAIFKEPANDVLIKGPVNDGLVKGSINDGHVKEPSHNFGDKTPSENHLNICSTGCNSSDDILKCDLDSQSTIKSMSANNGCEVEDSDEFQVCAKNESEVSVVTDSIVISLASNNTVGGTSSVSEDLSGNDSLDVSDDFQDFAQFCGVKVTENAVIAQTSSKYEIEDKTDASQDLSLLAARSDSGIPDNSSNDAFQDFAQFHGGEFTEILQHDSNEIRRENIAGVPHILSIPFPVAQNGSSCSSAENTDDDKYSDFAHFNDIAETDINQNSASSPSELSSSCFKEEKEDKSIVIAAPQHSIQEVQSSCIDNSSENAVFSGNTASVQLKSNDSIYSNVSTLDSGVFSADLSPSCHINEVSDASIDIDKENTLMHGNSSVQQNDTTKPHLQSTSRSTFTDSTKTSEKLCESVIGDSDVCVMSESVRNHQGNSTVSNKDDLSSKLNQVDFCDSDNSRSSIDLPDGKKSCDGEENSTAKSSSFNCGHGQHSTSAQKTESSNHSTSPTQEAEEILHTYKSAVFTENSNIEKTVENQMSTSRSLTEANKENKKESAFSNEARCKDKSELSVRNLTEDPEGIISDKVDSKGSLSFKISDKQNTDLDNHELPINNEDNSKDADEGCDSDSDADNDEDKEFGDFSSYNKRKDSDPHGEVAPIKFRTSLCEDEEDDADEDFTFNREKPLSLTVEGDDFGEFGAADGNVCGDDSYNDFGDFDSAQKLEPSSSASSLNKHDEGSADFGDFGMSQSMGNDDTEWADFGAATNSAEIPVSVASASTNQALQSENSEQSKAQKVQRAVLSCFPESPVESNIDPSHLDKEKGSQSMNTSHAASSPKEEFGPLPLDTVVDLGLSNALEAKQQTWTVVQHPAKKDPKVRLWAHLKDVDSCHALTYGWPASHCSKEVFSTLHIDTQNVLFTQKKQAVPFFASGLGILEPIRSGGGLDGKKGKKSLPPAPVTLLDTSRHDHPQNSPSQEIPPVDFDWSSSGLTNPLTVFKADNQDSTRNTLQPLEDILKKTTPTAKFVTNEVLSPEAARILEKMPDLSFMQSGVLMFPVKQ